MGQVVADVVNAQLQVVDGTLPLLMEKITTATSKINEGIKRNKGAIKKISNQTFRIPVQTSRGGSFGGFSMASGDMLLGTGAKFQQFTQTYFATKVGFQVDEETIETTEDSSQSLVNAMLLASKTGIEEMAIDLDLAWHATSQGLIATANASSNTANSNTVTYTFKDNAFGCDLLRDQMPVNVYDNTVTLKSDTNQANCPTVTQIDKIGKTALVSGGTAFTHAATDILAFQMVSPGTPAFKHGLSYFNNVSATTLLGLSTSTYPEILPNRVNAASTTIDPAYGLALKDQIRSRRGADAVMSGDLIGFAHMAQRAQVYKQQVAISEFYAESKNKPIDIMPITGDDFVWCGVKIYVDERQNRSRVDLINTMKWGKANLFDPRFKRDKGTNRMWFELRGASGGVAAGYLMYVEEASDWFCLDAGSQGYVDNLTVPSQYN